VLSKDAVHRAARGADEQPLPVKLVGAGDFLVDAPICPGDSGGPAWLEPSAEVLGVISMSVMHGDETKDVSTFTRLDVWRTLFSAARLIADGSSPAEVPPIEGCEEGDPLLSPTISNSTSGGTSDPREPE
jgi:hypothetical protein